MDLVRTFFPPLSIVRLNDLLEGMYGNFAGRDASRGMAKQSFDVGAFVSFFFFSAELTITSCVRHAYTYRPTT